MIILIIARLLDIITTLLNVNKWGWGVEGNPIVRWTAEQGYFFYYQSMLVLIVIFIAEAIPKYRQIIYISVSCLSLIAMINNLFCFFFIK